MTSSARYILIAAVVIGGLLSELALGASAQSHALNGQIEGLVLDQTGATVADAEITITNIETRAARSTRSDRSGIYQFPLLPLGNWRIEAEVPGFKRIVRDGVTLSAGQTKTLVLLLVTGGVEETVTVFGDVPVVDTGRTELGRVMNSLEVHNIPLPSRNPYNFIFLQANVTGRQDRGPNFPKVNVNGFARRINYLLDGNTNTAYDRAGVRLSMLSDTYVNEIQLVTNGFAAEFGNTTGIIMNIVTPSGTNEFHGSAAYFLRRPWFYARPFFFSGRALPDNVTNNLAATIGGPIIKDRWHFYFGYEYLSRDDSSQSNRQVRISEADRTAMIAGGLSSSIFVAAIPGQDRFASYILRTDLQLDNNNRLAARFNLSDGRVVNYPLGGSNTMERSVDLIPPDHSLGVQLVSYTPALSNELRFQHAWRSQKYERNESSGNGPAVTITNIASFGSPTNAGSVKPLINVTQVHDNVTLTHGSHAIKFGGGFVFLDSLNRDPVFSHYTFSSIPDWVGARNGNRYGYAKYEESFGDPEISAKETFWNLFVQDEWKITRRLKLNYGLRYDLYLVPKADPSSPFPASRKFNIDRNNFAPRFGLVYALREGERPLVLRAGGGIYYEPAWLDMYSRALLKNGAPRFFNLHFCGTNTQSCQQGPAFPNTFSGSQPSGSVLPQQDIVTVAPDFENMYAIHSNVQLEQALTEDLSLAVGYVHSGGRHIPVYRNINPINPGRLLADGRPVFGLDRLDARFKVIQMAESAASSQYDALTLQLTERFSRGLQFSANYTFSKATDDAPEQNVPYFIGNNAITSFVLSDPTNRALDKGYSYGDQRHTFVMSAVARPKFETRNKLLRQVLNNNQFGIITTANSGERFTIAAGLPGNNGTLTPLDVNGDELSFSDRPVGIKRNSGKTPPQFNLDLRYSRFIDLTERYRLEVFCEVQNLFNINNIVAYNNVLVSTNPTTGQLIGELPDFKARNASVSIESRNAQLGLRFSF
jgi:hypothetical protein